MNTNDKLLKPEDIYKTTIEFKRIGILGDSRGTIEIKDEGQLSGFIKAFWEDNQIQCMELTSTNMGFIDRFTKVYK